MIFYYILIVMKRTVQTMNNPLCDLILDIPLHHHAVYMVTTTLNVYLSRGENISDKYTFTPTWGINNNNNSSSKQSPSYLREQFVNRKSKF